MYCDPRRTQTMNVNLNSHRESLPISVESTPRNNTTLHDVDLGMPDLVAGGSGSVGAVTPRDEEGRRKHLNDVTEMVSLVDSFNGVYQRQIHYYEQNYESDEAMRVSFFC